MQRITLYKVFDLEISEVWKILFWTPYRLPHIMLINEAATILRDVKIKIGSKNVFMDGNYLYFRHEEDAIMFALVQPHE